MSRLDDNRLEEELADFTDKLMKRVEPVEESSMFKDEEFKGLAETVRLMGRASAVSQPDTALTERLHTRIVAEWQQFHHETASPVRENFVSRLRKLFAGFLVNQKPYVVFVALMVLLLVVAVFSSQPGDAPVLPGAAQDSGNQFTLFIMISGVLLAALAGWWFNRRR